MPPIGLASPPLDQQHRRPSRRRLLTSTATPRHHFQGDINNVVDVNPAAVATSCNNNRNINHRSSLTNAHTHYGLLITLEEQEDDGTTPRLCFQFCPDRNLKEIHPNSYGPAALQDVHKLGGGGSGVAVFAGYNNEMGGHVVMKHGSDKDLTELFALCEVSHELQLRSEAHPEAAARIQQRIPAFRFIYISPHHLGEKRKALWDRLRDISRLNDTIMFLPIDEMFSLSSITHHTGMEDEPSINNNSHNQSNNDGAHYSPTSWRSYNNLQQHSSQTPQSQQQKSDSHDEDDCNFYEDEVVEAEESFRMLKNASILDQYNLAGNQVPDNLPPGVEISKSGTFSGHREIAIVATTTTSGPGRNGRTGRGPQQQPQEEDEDDTDVVPHVKVKGESLIFVLPGITEEDDEERPPAEEGRQEQVEGSHNDNNNNFLHHSTTTNHMRKFYVKGDGYKALQSIYYDLLSLMKSHKWKFTLGQKLIGGSNPRTGNEWLYGNQLRGSVLGNLITQKIQLVRDLVRLTTLEEQDPIVLENIRKETKQIIHRQSQTHHHHHHQHHHRQHIDAFNAADLSPEADAFVGNAIRKNFRSETGRLPMLMLLGKHFREHEMKEKQQYHLQLQRQHQHNNHKKGRPSFLHHYEQHHHPKGGGVGGRGPNLPRHNSLSSLVLTPEEQIPAHHLGQITNPGALMGNTFEKSPLEPTVLESMGPHYWQLLLTSAVQQQQQHQVAATTTTNINNNTTMTTTMVWKRLWTCGLADAGLHNLFCSDSRLWLFDLGEPQLTSVPGFLTKFLFSFFHTLGMEEPPESGDGTTWVRRFDHNKRTGKLRLTSATSQLLSQAYDAFAMSLDRIVKELFNGDDSVRWLLLQYVTLQLVSDASFCLQKWTIKGGGRARDSNHQEGLEKWLWRALWDIYVACDINSQNSLRKLKVQPTKEQEVKVISPTLRERQMALIQELALETTIQLDSPRPSRERAS